MKARVRLVFTLEDNSIITYENTNYNVTPTTNVNLVIHNILRIMASIKGENIRHRDLSIEVNS